MGKVVWHNTRGEKGGFLFCGQCNKANQCDTFATRKMAGCAPHNPARPSGAEHKKIV